MNRADALTPQATLASRSCGGARLLFHAFFSVRWKTCFWSVCAELEKVCLVCANYRRDRRLELVNRQMLDPHGLKAAKTLIKNGRRHDAIAVYQAILADDPENVDAFLALADLRLNGLLPV